MSLVKIYHYDNKDHNLRKKYNVEFDVYESTFTDASAFVGITRIWGKNEPHQMGVIRRSYIELGMISDEDRVQSIGLAIDEYEKIYKPRKSK